MNRLEYEEKLKEVYNGAVEPLRKYLNLHSTMKFYCNKCGVAFYGKAGHIIGKDHQRHECGLPYGDRDGNRFHVWSNKNKKSKKNVKIDGVKLVAQLDELLNEGQPYQTIRNKTGVDIHLIDYYANTLFKKAEEKPVNLTFFKATARGRKAYIDEAGKLYMECNNCQEVKDINLFQNTKIGFLGKLPFCKNCANKKQ